MYYLKTRRENTALFVLAIAIVVSLNPMKSIGAEFLSLGSFPDGHSVDLSGPTARYISDDGLVITGEAPAPGGHGVFRWTRETGMIALNNEQPANLNSQAMSSDGGTVWWGEGDRVGEPLTRVWSSSNGVARLDFRALINSGSSSSATGAVASYRDGNLVRWTYDQEFESLADLPQGWGGQLFSTPDGTVIAGRVRGDVNPADRLPYRWTADQGVQYLETLPSDNIYSVAGISDDGSVIVGTSNATVDRRRLLWRWTDDNGMSQILPGSADKAFASGFTSQGRIVSADGAIIVGSLWDWDTEANSNGNNLQAFHWTEETGLQLLPALHGFTQSLVADMTADGSMILGLSANDRTSDGAYWLWTEETGQLSVEDVFVSQGIESSFDSWQQLFVPGTLNLPKLSADGQAITGTGINADGQWEAWVAYIDPIVVPEPGSLAIICTGLLSIGVFRRRRRQPGG